MEVNYNIDNDGYNTDDQSQLSQDSYYVEATEIIDELLPESAADANAAVAKPKRGRPRKSLEGKKVSRPRGKRQRCENTSPAQPSRDHELYEAKLKEIIDQLVIKATNTFETKLTEITTGIEQRITTHLDATIEEKLTTHLSKVDDRIDAIATSLGSYQTAVASNSTDIIEMKKTDISLGTRIKLLEDQMAELENKTVATAAPSPDAPDVKQLLKDQHEENVAALQQVNRHIERIETHSRKLNLVFEGIEEKEGENCKQIVESLIRSEMKFTAGIDIAHRLRKTSPHEPAGLIARFRTVAEKSRVIQNGAALKGRRIYIRPDLPLVTMQRRNYLAKSLAGARQSDPNAKLVHDKIVIHGRYYDENTIYTADLTDNKHSHSTDDQVRFYGYLCPLSNFHRCNITVNNINFCNAEQAYHFLKAKRLNAHHIAAEILRESNPATIKRISRQIKAQKNQKYSDEDDMEIMKQVIEQKFTQNEKLGAFLLSTDSKTIMECNPHDIFFSTGTTMFDRNLDSMRFRGRNVLGTILKDVRDNVLAK